MANDSSDIILATKERAFTLAVDIHDPLPIKLFTVTEDALNKLESTSEREQYSIAGASVSVGIAASGWIALATSPPTGIVALVIVALLTLLMTISTIVCCVLLKMFRAERKKISEQIRTGGNSTRKHIPLGSN